MHYYNFHIGDYKSHTHHLSPIEDIAFRRLLDLYYMTEKPIIADQAARLIGMREYGDDVLCVLVEFFEETELGYINKRADEEISAYRTKVEQASRAGKRSAEKRLNGRKTPVGNQFNGRSTDVQLTNNQEPITNNQDKNINTFVPKDALLSLGVTEAVAVDWLHIRKAKKSAVTETAIKGLVRESELAGISINDALAMCCERGWSGFKSEWILNQAKTKTHNPAVLSI